MVDRAESDGVRAAEVVASLCLATDLGMGFPFEHGLRATLMAMRLADLLDVDSDTRSRTFYVSLLMYVGCTTDAHVASSIFPGGLTVNMTPVEYGSSVEGLTGAARAVTPPGASFGRRLYERARRLPEAARFRKPHYAAVCEVAEMVAERLGLTTAITDLFSRMTERWDGKGVLGRAAADEIPISVRIARVAREAAFQQLVHGRQEAVSVIRARAGMALDPVVAETFVGASGDVVSAGEGNVWEGVLAAEPKPWLELRDDEIERALGAMGMFSDLVAPYLSGHSTGVSELAAKAAEMYGLQPSEVTAVRRAGLTHDLGRVAVYPGVWSSEGPLSVDEWEQVRLHPYHTERILAHSSFLTDIGNMASCHHERLDGSGYHRRLGAQMLSPGQRLLAAADAFHAMTEPRAHRRRYSPEEAASLLIECADEGLYDADMVSVVVEASGLAAPPVRRPADLTEREAEVLGLIARGLQTKQVARALNISPKTADNHLQSVYRKIGVSTRAAATLFAMEHGILA